jgi:uncharacterized protein
VRQALLIALFLGVVLTVLAGGHWYLAQRLVFDPGFPRAAGGVLAALAATLVAAAIGERLLPRRATRALSWVASIWMGLAFYLLVGLVTTDTLALLLGASGGDRHWAVVRALVVLGLAVGAGAAGVRTALAGPAVRRVELVLPRWPRSLDGFRIVQLSDLHVGPILDRRFVADLVARATALAPDLVAITGDLVDGSVARLADEVAPLAGLRAAHGVFFVTGNHDYYSGADAWVTQVRALGIRPLRNEHVTIGSGEASFDLAGVEDHHAHHVSPGHRSDVPAALAGRDHARPVVLLAHDPATFPEAARRGVDLQLSGHTHGGQIWPFHGLVRLATPFVAGHHRRGGAQLYVSRGTGFWGPAMRVRAQAEVTELVLRAA